MYDLIFQKVFKIVKIKHISTFISKLLYSIMYTKFIISYISYKNSTIPLTNSKGLLAINNLNHKVENTKSNIIRNKTITYDLSIIIPAYNSEKYISKCLNSIFNQHTKFNYEVIVINDGSTDNTLNILNSYKHNNNLIIITQKNSGISEARNKGLEVSSGQYIMFVDADDLLESNSIDLLLSEALENNIDIVEGNYLFWYEDNSTSTGKPYWTEKFSVNLLSNKDFISKIQGFPWGRIYLRDLWSNVNFPLNFDYEDTIIQLTVFQKASTFVYMPNNIYKYRITSNSISSRLKGSEKSLDAYFVVKYIIKENSLINIQITPELYKLILKHLGTLLYYRTKGVSENYINAMLLDISKFLESLEYYSPNNLTKSESYLKSSILQHNKNRWQLCCKYLQI